jgi:hypothetical protein
VVEGVLVLGSIFSGFGVAFGSLPEQVASLAALVPLGVALVLLSGYESIVAFVGRVDGIPAACGASSSGLMIGPCQQDGMVAIFLCPVASLRAEALLESAGFPLSPIPPGTGSVPALLSDFRTVYVCTVGVMARLV